MPHICKALVLTCMDFRLQDQLKKWLDEQALCRDYDLLAVAGASMELAKPSDGKIKDFLLSNIGISSELHQAQKVILIHHSDCGAYGGRAAFANEEQEKAVHAQDMAKSAEAIKNKYPNLEVLKVYALIKEEGIGFETIV